MSHKLILIKNQKHILTAASTTLMSRIKTNDLLQRVPWRSTEFACWLFSAPFLSVINNSNVKIIQNHDDIIEYLKKLPPKRTIMDPTKDLFF